MSLESPLAKEHEKLGAAMGVRFGARLPETDGDFAAEYRRALETAAVADTNFQLVAELAGPDRLRYLNAVSTGDIRDLEPGRSALGLLLNPQGRILAELRTLALADRLMVFSHAMSAERTLKTLEQYIIMDDVALADRSAEYATLALVGPAARAVIDELAGAPAIAPPDGSHRETVLGGMACRLHSPTHLGLPGVELIAGRDRIEELWRMLVEATARHGGGPAGYAALDAVRLEAGVPWFGADFDERVIPHEAGLEHSHISYTKGCYTGQEIVERVRSRGQVNRRRVGLVFSGEGVPLAGAKLTAGGGDVGWITSAADSPLVGRAIGMGYLRREFHAVGSRVDWAGGVAEVVALPLGASGPQRDR
ncbi:MAG TPA: glycine cleavage T C-terminal barrel domain-containing protein [Candidatus Acidoferrales bacterium]|nr:glycine cleavage T C-terminal barrel domain-containing protein [Candidatus Acidoferrales bacterium]